MAYSLLRAPEQPPPCRGTDANFAFQTLGSESDPTVVYLPTCHRVDLADLANCLGGPFFLEHSPPGRVIYCASVKGV